MQLSARGAQSRRDESRKLNMYSKNWTPGDTLRVKYPLIWTDGVPDILVGAVWGHSVSDIKGLGLKTAFIPSTTDFDNDRNPVGPADITYQFSLIAPVIVAGMKANEEAQVSRKKWPTDAELKNALKDVEEKYDSKNNMNAVKPIISKVQYLVTTEVVSVKIANDAIVRDTAAISCDTLSRQKITQLYSILNDKKYCPEEGAKFLEVEWKYPVNPDKGQSAKAATPNGLTPEYRLEAKYPDAVPLIQSLEEQVIFESCAMSKRATRAVDPQRVKQALTRYCYMNNEALDATPADMEELLLKHADVIHELNVEGAFENAELIDKIKNALSEMEALNAQTAEVPPTPSEADLITEPAVSDAASAEIPEPVGTDNLPDLSDVTGAPSVEDLLKGADQSLTGEEDLINVDLGGV